MPGKVAMIDTSKELRSQNILLRPLRASDIEALHRVASDPLIWEQHPQHDRWRREVFQTFFDGAMAHGTAYVIIDTSTGDIIGSTRYYEPAADGSYIYIGYTFFARSYWGKGANQIVKQLMLEHAFSYVPQVRFQIGVNNMRSRIAVERLGAEFLGYVEVRDPGAAVSPHVEYALNRPVLPGK